MRREFIALVGGAVALWPLAGRGQQPDQMRRIGVLQVLADEDPETVARPRSRTRWAVGRNMRIDYRSAGGDANRLRKLSFVKYSQAIDR
jgi:putative tryptophan/tyrosine transport system substrate-binding protein